MWFARRFLSSVVQRSQYAGQCGLFRRPQHCSLPEVELRYLQCTCCWRSRVPVAGFETLDTILTSSSTTASKSDSCNEDSSRPLDANYTSEQRHSILQLLNTASESELSSVKLLRGRRSVAIVEYRTEHGPFETLESLLNVPRLKHKTAVTVFNSILHPVKKERKVKTQLARFIKPAVDRVWLEDANSIVSIICGANRIAWANVDRGMNLLDWQKLECPNFLQGTYMASAYLDDVSAVVSLLPSADFYIVEKSSISLQNTTLFPIMAHMQTVEAMLFALLEIKPPKLNTDIPRRVVNMLRTAVGRHFQLMVGDSRTSGARLVRQLMTESVTKKIPRVNIPPELLLKYGNAFHFNSRRDGEELCDALLQAIAFYELLSLSDKQTTSNCPELHPEP